MRYRKKYSSEEAKNKIENLKMGLQNCHEELMFWYSPLILALVWKTEEQCRKEADKKMTNIMEEIDYVKQFL